MRLSPVLLVVLGGPITTNDLVLAALMADGVQCSAVWFWGSMVITAAYVVAVTLSGRQQSRDRQQ